MLPRTTVVIPTIGRPALVSVLRCLRSQTVPVDVVVVDDSPAHGRSDAIRGWVADELSGAEVEATVISTGGIGPSAARNAGIDKAPGPIIGLLDDDDVVCPHHIERLTGSRTGTSRFFAWNACQMMHVDEHGGARMAEAMLGWPDAAEKLDFANVVPPSCTAFTKDIAPVFDPSLPTLEDWDAWLQITHKAKVAPAYTGRVTVGKVKDVSAVNSVSLRSTADLAELQTLIDIYWTICDRYPARDEAGRNGRQLFREKQQEWLRTLSSEERLGVDHYEEALTTAFGPPQATVCCDFDFCAAARQSLAGA